MNQQRIPKSVPSPNADQMAGALYTTFQRALPNPDHHPFPDWATFCMDHSNEAEAHAWLAVGQQAIELLKPEPPHPIQPRDKKGNGK